MRFAKWPKPAAYENTSRKRAAFATKQRREREALQLFADMIAANQHSVDEEMARRAVWWPQQQQRLRDGRAAVWRRARARLFEFLDHVRCLIRRAWRDCPYPADPYSLADFLHQIRVGKVDPERPPWRYHARAQARTTPNPASFAEAFKRIGQHTVESASGLSVVEAPHYCGNLGNGILFLDALPPMARWSRRTELAILTTHGLPSAGHEREREAGGFVTGWEPGESLAAARHGEDPWPKRHKRSYSAARATFRSTACVCPSPTSAG